MTDANSREVIHIKKDREVRCMKRKITEREQAAATIIFFLFVLSQGFTWDLVKGVTGQNSLAYMMFQCWGMLFFAYASLTINKNNYLRRFVVSHPALLEVVKFISVKITMALVYVLEQLYVAMFKIGQSESGAVLVRQTRKLFMSEYDLYSWDMRTTIAVMISTMICSVGGVLIYSCIDQQHVYENIFMNCIAMVSGIFALSGMVSALDESDF